MLFGLKQRRIALGLLVALGGNIFLQQGAIADKVAGLAGNKQVLNGIYTESLEAGNAFQQAMDFYQRGEFPRANKYIEIALNFDPWMPMAHYLQGQLFVEAEKPRKAQEEYYFYLI